MMIIASAAETVEVFEVGLVQVVVTIEVGSGEECLMTSYFFIGCRSMLAQVSIHGLTALHAVIPKANSTRAYHQNQESKKSRPEEIHCECTGCEQDAFYGCNTILLRTCHDA